MMSKKLYSVIETGKLLGIGKNKVYELIEHGYLMALDLGGLKIPEKVIDQFISDYSGYSFKNMDAVCRLNPTL